MLYIKIYHYTNIIFLTKKKKQIPTISKQKWKFKWDDENKKKGETLYKLYT